MSLVVGDLLDHRYRLHDCIRDLEGAREWFAVDEVLRRPVKVLTVRHDDPRAAALPAAATRAAGVTHPAVMRVLDRLDTPDVLAVISAWTDARPLREVVAPGPLDNETAMSIAGQVADALDGIHRSGAAHLCLSPDTVFVSDEGRVRVLGTELEALLLGVEASEPGGEIDDLIGVGRVLCFCLTKRWPRAPRSGLPKGPPVPDFPAPPLLAGRMATPRQITPGIPYELDRTARRLLQISSPAEGRPLTLGSAASLLAGDGTLAPLTRATTDDPHHHVPHPGTGDIPLTRTERRLRFGAVAMFAGLVLAMGALLVFETAIVGRDATGSSAPLGPTHLPSERPITAKAVYDFDPYGDGHENHRSVHLATDGELDTAWHTITYYSALSGQKRGVGLLFDFGHQVDLLAIQTVMEHSGTDAILYVAEPGVSARPKDLSRLTVVASIGNAPRTVSATFRRPVTTRWAVLWLTDLPVVEGGWRGGITEVVWWAK